MYGVTVYLLPYKIFKQMSITKWIICISVFLKIESNNAIGVKIKFECTSSQNFEKYNIIINHVATHQIFVIPSHFFPFLPLLCFLHGLNNTYRE